MNQHRYDLVCENYVSFDDVIISCYTDDEFLARDVPHIQIVRSKVHDMIRNPQNLHLQILTSQAGIALAKNPYCAKVRSDESSRALHALKFMKLDDNRIYCSNIYIRSPWYIPLTLSDHVMLSTTQNLFRTFNTCLEWIRLKDEDLISLNAKLFKTPFRYFYKQPNDKNCCNPEAFIFISFLHTMGVDLTNVHLDPMKSLQLQKKFLGIIDIGSIDLNAEKKRVHTNISDIEEPKHFDDIERLKRLGRK